jgi:hypothetical protein
MVLVLRDDKDCGRKRQPQPQPYELEPMRARARRKSSPKCTAPIDLLDASKQLVTSYIHVHPIFTAGKGTALILLQWFMQ